MGPWRAGAAAQFATNVTGTQILLELAKECGVKQFMFASSSSVYGPETPLLAREDGPADPCSPYALTKLQGEQWGRIRE